MKSYEIALTNRAERIWKKLDERTKERIRDGLRRLVDYYNGKAEHLPDVKQLKGKYKGLFRLRVGDYRVIFDVIEERLIILIIEIVPRKNAYR